MVTLDELVVDSDSYYSLLAFIMVARDLGIITKKQHAAMDNKFDAKYVETYGICEQCECTNDDCRCHYDEESTGYIYNDE